jgi:pilus assembly protein Flp/PilA
MPKFCSRGVKHDARDLKLGAKYKRVTIMKKFLADETGATAIEYGLIAAAMGVCLIAAMPLITGPLITQFTSLGSKITTPAT